MKKILFGVFAISTISIFAANAAPILSEAKSSNDPFDCAQKAVTKALNKQSIVRKKLNINGRTFFISYKDTFERFNAQKAIGDSYQTLRGDEYDLVGSPFWYPLDDTKMYIPLDGNDGLELATLEFNIKREAKTGKAISFSCQLVDLWLNDDTNQFWKAWDKGGGGIELLKY
jgi:hypothetical protein